MPTRQAIDSDSALTQEHAPPNHITRLAAEESILESVAAGRLVVLCGAGLSMASPSKAPSAAEVVTTCANAYNISTGIPLPQEVSTDIEQMALWFRDRNHFEDLFIGTLVPWGRFKGRPNAGHEAIADMLACGDAYACVTTNYDLFLEAAAAIIGEPDFQPIVETEDIPRSSAHRPYLKLHGCAHGGRSRTQTIWCKPQLDDSSLASRLHHFKAWLHATLLGRDLLVIGFWSDWAYLSEILADSVNAIGPRTVIAVDPAPLPDLQRKAPQLFAWANRASRFIHVPESGSTFLERLRQRISALRIRRAILEARDEYRALFGEEVAGTVSEELSLADLYALRRDLSGTPIGNPARDRTPASHRRIIAAFHAKLMAKGATYSGHLYMINNEAIRLIDGGGQLLSQVRRNYENEPRLPIIPTRVVCVGSIPDCTPHNYLASDDPPTVVRSSPGDNWQDQAKLETLLRQTT
jgi:hypothetical protein